MYAPLTLVLKEMTPVPRDEATSAGVPEDDWRKAGEECRADMRAGGAPESLRGAAREERGTIRRSLLDTRRELLSGDISQ